jgi:hypothetical protein
MRAGGSSLGEFGVTSSSASRTYFDRGIQIYTDWGAMAKVGQMRSLRLEKENSEPPTHKEY